jgi:hypothetical protein
MPESMAKVLRPALAIRIEVVDDSSKKYRFEDVGSLVADIPLHDWRRVFRGGLTCDALIRWAIHRVLYFPVAPSELLSLLAVILGVTVVATLVMWSAGRFKGQW